MQIIQYFKSKIKIGAQIIFLMLHILFLAACRKQNDYYIFQEFAKQQHIDVCKL